MADLRLNIIVDDNGGVQKVQQLESAVKGVENAATSSSNAVNAAATQSSNAFGRMSSAASSWLKTASAVYGGVLIDRGISALADWTHEAMQSASALTDMNAKTGLAISTLQKLDFVGAQAGVSLETFANAAYMLGIRLGKGSKGVVGAVEELGLNIKALQAMRPDEQMHAIMSALAGIGSETDRNRIGAELFGKQFKGISASVTSDYDAMWNAAVTSGDEQIKALDAMGDAWERFVKNQKARIAGFLGSTVLAVNAASKVGVAAILEAIGKYGVGGAIALAAGQGVSDAAAASHHDINLPSPNAKPHKTADELAEEKRAQRAAEAAQKAAERAAEAWQKVNDELSGQAAMDAADTLLQHLAEVGGLTMISEKATKHLSTTLEDAISAYARLGRIAPKAMMDTYLATLQAQLAVQNGIDAAKHNTLPGFVAPRSLEIPVPNMGFSSGLSGTLPGSVPAIYANGMGAVAAPLAALSVSYFHRAFEKFGEELPDLIFNGLRSGAGTGQIAASLVGALGQQFSQQYQAELAKVGGDRSQLSGKQQAMGIAGMGISTAIQGYALGQQYGKAKGALAGAASGAMAGTMIMPGIGTAIGAGIGALAGFFGGRSADKKAKQAMEDDRAALLQQYGGMEKLKSLAESLGVSIGNAFSTKKPAEFKTFVDNLNAALDKQKTKLEGIAQILDGVNSRAKIYGETLSAAAEHQSKTLADTLKSKGIDPNSTEGKALATQSGAQFTAANQDEFNTVGAMAFGAFGASVQENGGPLGALMAMQPTLAVLNQAQKDFNFTASETTQRLLDINAAVQKNLPAFQALTADGQILNGMVKANWSDMGLFAATSKDVGDQIGRITANGMPMSQALALNQPVLQSLWEAEEKFGFKADAATQSLIDQAAKQGLVGKDMKDVNQKILDVLLLIGKALGADIPEALSHLPSAAQAAADGMNTAFDGVRPPKVTPDESSAPSDTGDSPGYLQGGRVLAFMHGGRVPQYLARGSWVNWRPQGSDTVPAMLTPGEIVLNAAQQRNVAGKVGGGGTAIIQINGRDLAEIVVPSIPGVVKRYRVGVR